MKNNYIPQRNEIIEGPKNYNEFQNTIRQYAERLREEKDISLRYLNEINSMSEMMRAKDAEIERLKKANK